VHEAAAITTGSINLLVRLVRARGKGHWAGDRKQTTLLHDRNKVGMPDTVQRHTETSECMRAIPEQLEPTVRPSMSFMIRATLIRAETHGAHIASGPS